MQAAVDYDVVGYGQRVVDPAEFSPRFKGLAAVLLDDPLMFCCCCKRLIDVCQEQGGVATLTARCSSTSPV